MENNEILAAKIKELLRDAKTEKAIKLLEKEDLGKFNSDVILLSGRFSEMKKKEVRGTVTKEESQTELNQIRSNIMDLMDEIEKSPKEILLEDKIKLQKAEVIAATEKIKPQVQSQPSSSSNAKKYGLIAGALLLLIAAVTFGINKSKKGAAQEAEALEIESVKKKKDAETKRLQDSIKIANVKIKADSIERAKNIFIGNQFEGGIIFHVDKSGAHGLIVALSDALIKGESKPKVIDWFNGIDNPSVARATGVELNTGKSNTSKIVDLFKEGNYPASLASNYGPSKFTDWYLPSRKELDLLYDYYKAEKSKKSIIFETLDFQHEYYWSSTEVGNTGVYYRSFFDGNYFIKLTNKARVRAIRQF